MHWMNFPGVLVVQTVALDLVNHSSDIADVDGARVGISTHQKQQQQQQVVRCCL
jgi:hypothetical protein